MLPAKPKNPNTRPETTDLKAFEEWSTVNDKLEEDWKATIDARKRESDYVAMDAAYGAYHDLQTLLIASMFKPTALKKSNWCFDGSMMTDGVAASVQYSKTVLVPRKKKNKGPKDELTKKKLNMTKLQDDEKIIPDDKYDRTLSTLVRFKDGSRCIVAADDPGCVDIASITYCLKDADQKEYPKAMTAPKEKSKRTKERSWSLSGAEYRKRSGIREEDMKKKQRFRSLEESWSAMGKTSSLKTLRTGDIENYLRQYLVIEEKWWSIALRRGEARATFRRYMGKRKVLDGFFSRVDNELKRIFPGAAVMLAYGSAGLTMKSSGVGRVAVPTTSAYKAATRIFGSRCCVQDEWGTTKYDYATGEVKHAVYRVPEGADSWKLSGFGHTDKKSMPNTTVEDARVVKAYWKETIERNRLRRGGLEGQRLDETGGREEEKEKEKERKKKYESRYPEIRGLRYLPSTRTYFGRDSSSAGCIARLAAYRLMFGTKRKPAPFCRGKKAKEEEQPQPAEEEQDEIHLHESITKVS